jgi:hypothetical protein
MKQYIGTKLISGMPMTLGDYNVYQGWDIPEDQDPAKEGYLVEYTDGGEANHPKHAGYISWSPKEQFENAYEDTSEAMTFGHALVALKQGLKVARAGWNGKGMWIILVPGNFGIRPVAGTPYSKAGLTADVDIDPHMDMFTAGGSMQPGWLASQADMLAEDWVIV